MNTSEPTRDIREMTHDDAPLFVDYFLGGSDEFLAGMGADVNKLPSRDAWISAIREQLPLPYREKAYFYFVWLLNGKPVGHSNINHIEFGKTARMHLHMWNTDHRQSGLGTWMLKRCIPLYFKHFELKELFCEPYAENVPPNKTLPKLGFHFVKRYHTIPGPINLPQDVNRWIISREEGLVLRA